MNAKRYNWLAREVSKNKGWKITPMRQKDHPGYFEQNDITDADVRMELETVKREPGRAQ